ncbi:MAG: signal peptide peptidase SppA [Desulfosarcinaceae bacterium]|nr:signal peptide peptidase SppA [Desulfosarcinaceae bacterium]
MNRQDRIIWLTGLIITLLLIGCAPRVTLFGAGAQPLKEFTVSGEGTDKLLVITVRGVISHLPRRQFVGSAPSMVERIVAQLNKAAMDDRIKGVLMKIDSPGGSTTASDILYHEINSFRERTRKPVSVAMLNVAASGGYYIALPADLIMAHPTTVTGSIGVIYARPRMVELLEKVGVGVTVNKSGENKDMGSPFRPPTIIEEELFQEITDTLANRFLDLVAAHRQLTPETLNDVASARIYLAADAQRLGLIDEIVYLPQAIERAKELCGLEKGARVVVYRRRPVADDTLYSTVSASAGGADAAALLGVPRMATELGSGFHYLWQPGLSWD